jgi:hypothetical protein
VRTIPALLPANETCPGRGYPIGLTEAAGNFQDVNFTGQGLGNDEINTEPLDGANTLCCVGGQPVGLSNNTHVNNANFSTPPDGINPRMQMFLFHYSQNPTDPFVASNGGDEADIVYHEFTHGLSTASWWTRTATRPSAAARPAPWARRGATGTPTTSSTWQVFAHRGMGWFAGSVDGDDTAPVQDFQTPPPPSPFGKLLGKVQDRDTREADRGHPGRVRRPQLGLLERHRRSDEAERPVRRQAHPGRDVSEVVRVRSGLRHGRGAGRPDHRRYDAGGLAAPPRLGVDLRRRLDQVVHRPGLHELRLWPGQGDRPDARQRVGQRLDRLRRLAYHPGDRRSAAAVDHRDPVRNRSREHVW